MNIENQVCTFEQAKLFKSLGIDQQGYYSYAHRVVNSKPSFNGEMTEWEPEYSEAPELIETALAQFDGLPHMSVFTVAELGVMLPDYYPSWRFKKNEQSGERLWVVTVICSPKPPGIDDFHTASAFDRYAKTQAEALATLLIALLETDVITPAEVNERLK